MKGVVCLDDGPFVPRLRARGVPVDVARTGRRLGVAAGALRLRHLIRAQRPALIHANGIKAALVAARRAPAPRAVAEHYFVATGCSTRAVARRCRRVVAVSGAVAAGVTRPGVRVDVVHNGIPDPAADAGRGRRNARALVAGDGPRVALVGRLEPLKGQLELVDATPAMLAARPDVQVVLIGGANPVHPGHGDVVRRRVREPRP